MSRTYTLSIENFPVAHVTVTETTPEPAAAPIIPDTIAWVECPQPGQLPNVLPGLAVWGALVDAVIVSVDLPCSPSIADRDRVFAVLQPACEACPVPIIPSIKTQILTPDEANGDDPEACRDAFHNSAGWARITGAAQWAAEITESRVVHLELEGAVHAWLGPAWKGLSQKWFPSDAHILRRNLDSIAATDLAVIMYPYQRDLTHPGNPPSEYGPLHTFAQAFRDRLWSMNPDAGRPDGEEALAEKLNELYALAGGQWVQMVYCYPAWDQQWAAWAVRTRRTPVCVYPGQVSWNDGPSDPVRAALVERGKR